MDTVFRRLQLQECLMYVQAAEPELLREEEMWVRSV